MITKITHIFFSSSSFALISFFFMSFEITREHLNSNSFLSNLPEVFVDLHGNLSCAGWIVMVLNYHDEKIFGCFKGEQSMVLMLAGSLKHFTAWISSYSLLRGCSSVVLTALKSTSTLGNKLSEPHQHLQRLNKVSWIRWTSTGFRACCSWWCRSMSRTSKIPLDTLHGVVLRLIWDSWPSSVILQIFVS